MQPWTQEQVDALKIGDKIRRNYNVSNRINELFHVRAIVDGCAVVRVWGGQIWYYKVMPHYALFDNDIVESP